MIDVALKMYVAITTYLTEKEKKLFCHSIIVPRNMNETKSSEVESKDVVHHSHRIGEQKFQNILLIWLDNNIDENNDDSRNTINQLQQVINIVDIFTDEEKCLQFLNDKHDEKSCMMIISGSLGQHIVPQIHDLVQVDSIFIFCNNKKYHESWTQNWPKIKGIFTEITSICNVLKQTIYQCEQDSISISFVDTRADVSNVKLDQLDPSFMYSTIIKEILLTIQFEQKHVQEYLDYCREAFIGNKGELQNINNFECKRHEKSPVWWYTCECFLYPMLNRALRFMDTNIIIKMGFFIKDLHEQIDRLHKQQFGNDGSERHLTVYRGQGMTKVEFNKLQQTKGGLLSFNNFLSTSKKREISMNFACNGATNPANIGILFVITIQADQSSAPFASIADLSCFGKLEDEVLFAMHSIFRIDDIRPMDDHANVYTVDLTLTNDSDKDFFQAEDGIRDESFPEYQSEGWYRLGIVLRKMGQFQKAQEVYYGLLEQETETSAKASIYGQLGLLKSNQGEYEEAIYFYQKALAILEQSTSFNYHDLSSAYNNMGIAYYSMSKFNKALLYYEKALAIRQQSLSPDHPQLATSYNNIGGVYEIIDQYDKALSYYEKAIAIKLKSLPSNHPSLANSYDNLGLLYEKMRDYSKAYSCFQKVMNIAQKSLPSDHPNLNKWQNHFDRVKNNNL